MKKKKKIKMINKCKLMKIRKKKNRNKIRKMVKKKLMKL